MDFNWLLWLYPGYEVQSPSKLLAMVIDKVGGLNFIALSGFKRHRAISRSSLELDLDKLQEGYKQSKTPKIASTCFHALKMGLVRKNPRQTISSKRINLLTKIGNSGAW